MSLATPGVYELSADAGYPSASYTKIGKLTEGAKAGPTKVWPKDLEIL